MRWLLGLPLVLVACGGDPCERQRSVATAKAEQCDLEVTGDTDVEAECTEDGAAVAACLTPCFRRAPCGAFDGSDADAMSELWRCQGDCLFPDAP